MKALILTIVTCCLALTGCVSESGSSSAAYDSAVWSSATSSARPKRQYSIEDFLDTVRIGGSSFSADESTILVSSDGTGIVNAYAVNLRTGERQPVTHSTNDSTFAVDYFPTDNRVLFTRDQGGNEENHLYVRTESGEERDLTPGEKLKALFVGWTRDDRAFYFQTNERDKRFFDLYRMDAGSFERALVYQNDQGLNFGDLSDDGKWLALEKPNTTSDSDIYLYDLTTKEMKHLSPHTGTARNSVAAFDRANRFLYYLTNDGE